MSILLRIGLVFLYCLIGLLLAVPVSYFFQSSTLQIMSLYDYVTNFAKVMAESARFGAFDIFRICAVASVLGTVILGNLLEKVFKR